MLFVLACGLVIAAHADAHAFLDHALPAVGSTIHSAPPEVRLWFTQELEPAFSAAQVTDQTGKRIDKADARVDENDRTLVIVSLPSLAPGRYTVHWRVLSVDTHATEGDYSFDVAR